MACSMATSILRNAERASTRPRTGVRGELGGRRQGTDLTTKRAASVNQNTSWIYKKVTNPPGGRICDFFVYHPICMPSNCCLVFVNSVKIKFYNPVAQRLGFFLNPGWVRAMGDMANAANRIKNMFSRIAVPSRTPFIPHRPPPKLLLGPASQWFFYGVYIARNKPTA